MFKEYPKWVDGKLIETEEEEIALTGNATKTKPAKQHTQKTTPYTPQEYPKWVDGKLVEEAGLEAMSKKELESYTLKAYEVDLDLRKKKETLIAEVEALGG